MVNSNKAKNKAKTPEQKAAEEAKKQEKAAAKKAAEEAQAQREAGIMYTQDGDKICATFGDFVNLEESPAWFGDTEEEAKADLIAKEKEIQKANKKKEEKDDRMVTLKNILPRTFNRIMPEQIITVKEEDASYYLENGFNYFGESAPVEEEVDEGEDESTKENVSQVMDDADKILKEVQGA